MLPQPTSIKLANIMLTTNKIFVKFINFLNLQLFLLDQLTNISPAPNCSFVQLLFELIAEKIPTQELFVTVLSSQGICDRQSTLMHLMFIEYLKCQFLCLKTNSVDFLMILR